MHTMFHNSFGLALLCICGLPMAEFIFVKNITNYIRGEKIAMWRNFSFPCMTIVGKLKISPHVEKFQYNWWGFIAIYAVLLLNLLFTLFCREIFATIYALSCGEKLSPKVHLWRKNDKYQVWPTLRQPDPARLLSLQSDYPAPTNTTCSFLYTSASSKH